MDDKMMSALLQSYGAPMNAKNATIARQFFASNPEVAEKRAMGMRGSALDDNSDLLGALLDKVMAETDAVPPGRVEVGAPQQLAPAAAPASDVPAARRASTPAGPQYGPPNSGPGDVGGDLSTPPSNPNASSGDGRSWWDLLWAAAGLSAAKPVVDNLGPRRTQRGPITDVVDVDARALPAPQQARLGYTSLDELEGRGDATQRRVGYTPKIEKTSPTEVRSSPENEQKAVDRESRYAKMRAEVEAENAALMEQLKQRQLQVQEETRRARAQRGTRETLDAARRLATGRR